LTACRGLLLPKPLFPRLRTRTHVITPWGGEAFSASTGYAISRAFVTNTDSGGTSFNASEVVGNALEAGLSTAYYPPQERGLSQTALNFGTQMESAVSQILGSHHLLYATLLLCAGRRTGLQRPERYGKTRDSFFAAYGQEADDRRRDGPYGWPSPGCQVHSRATRRVLKERRPAREVGGRARRKLKALLATPHYRQSGRQGSVANNPARR
jgi:hypothetical protein